MTDIITCTECGMLNVAHPTQGEVLEQYCLLLCCRNCKVKGKWRKINDVEEIFMANYY